MDFDYGHLVDHLRSGQLVAFMGAGVSRSYQDTVSGRNWPGLPTATELVATLTKKRLYVRDEMPFPEAMFLLKRKEGRAFLESFLVEQIDRPVVQPLPAHVLLANLPFSAYLTSNYDTLLERALTSERKKPFAVIQDTDVSRAQPTNTHVIKVHGCVSRPVTMVAAADEYVPLSEKCPIIDALVKAHLANKVVLFLGFGLGDEDFKFLFTQLKRSLGAHMPRSYAVVHSSSDFMKEYWLQNGVDVVESDLTDFLRGLLRATALDSPKAIYSPSEDWLNNAFFDSLHRIRTLPSETQVIDAFLKHFLEEVQSPSLALEEVITRATKAVSVVLSQRTNYEGLKAVSKQLLASIRVNCQSKEDAELTIKQLIAERVESARGISSKASKIIERADNILLYSQSIRVLDFLKGVPRGVQESCHLYVAECRPKSPGDFQDAISICENLKGSAYGVTIIPDVTIGNLIERRQITKILLGAHAIYLRNNEPVSFVNTCGSYLIIQIAYIRNISVYVVAEKTKIVHLQDGETPTVAYNEEESLINRVSGQISDLKASGLPIQFLNVGYDLCPFLGNVSLVSDN